MGVGPWLERWRETLRGRRDPARRIRGWVDGPWIAPAPFRSGHVVRLAGWCFDAGRRKPLSLELRLDDAPPRLVRCDRHRQDVHALHGARARRSSLPWCGFEIAFHAPGDALPRMLLTEAGTGVVLLDRPAQDEGVEAQVFEPRVNIVDPGMRRRGLRFHVDGFESWEGASADERRVALRGWCLAPAEPTDEPLSVELRADGRAVGRIPAAYVRPDVLAAFDLGATPERPAAFSGELSVPAEAERLELFCAEREVLLARALAADVRVDPPAGGAPARGRRYHIEHVGIFRDALGTGEVLDLRGWCFDEDASDPVALELVIDGRVAQRMVATDLRSVVGASFPGAAPGLLPRCGFTAQHYLSEETEHAELHHPRDGRLARWSIAELRARLEARDAYEDEADPGETFAGPPPYAQHAEANRVRPWLRAGLERAARALDPATRFSVVMPVCDPEPEWLAEAAASVLEGVHPHVELVLADDASTRLDVLALLERLEADDRVVVIRRGERGGISRATNDAAARATGDYLVFMDHDDLLAPQALYELARALARDPGIDVLYSDEDKVDLVGRRYDPMFKPDASPVLLLGFNYLNHLTCVRRRLFDAVGGLRSDYDAAQDHDLALRLFERTKRVHHVPRVLYHWRAVPGSIAARPDEKPAVMRSVEAALGDALERRGLAGVELYQPELARRFGLPIFQLEGADTGPSVSIVIPTRNQVDALGECVTSILERTTYRDFRVEIIDNGSDCPRTLSYLASLDDPRVRVRRIPNGPEGFSFSRVNNLAVDGLESDYVLFLNDDTEVLEPRWLSRMVRYAELDGVGAVGAKLLYPDDTLQHAGVLLHEPGRVAPDHAFLRQRADQLSRGFLAEAAREVSAVTGACLLTRIERFRELGGFRAPPFHVSLSDVDYCLRLAERDLSTLFVPGAVLRHHESLSRTREDDPAELAAFKRLHPSAGDAYANPNVRGSRAFEPSGQCTLELGEALGRPLRVSVYLHSLALEGMPKVIVELARGLRDRPDVELEVVAYAGGPLADELAELGVPVRFLELPGTHNVLAGFDGPEGLARARAHLRADLEAHRPDVVAAVVVHNFAVVNAAAELGIPSVWLIQESYERETLLRGVPDYAHPDLEHAFASVHRIAFAAETTRACYGWLGVRHRSEVIPNWVRLDRVDAFRAGMDRDAARRALGLPLDRPLLLSVGTLCARKHQESIVRAFAAIASEHPEADLVLVGAREGLSYNDLVAGLVERHGLGDRVRLVPETPDPFPYFRAADVFVLSSLLESHPIVVLEAMAFGLPLVVTPAAGPPEQIRPVSSRVVPYRDHAALALALSELLADAELRAELGAGARSTLEYLPGADELVARYRRLLWSAYYVGVTSTDSPSKAAR